MYYKGLICILLCISTNVCGYGSIEDLQKLTNLSYDVIKNWVHEFVAIEKWTEMPESYYSSMPNLINRYNLKIGCEVGVATGGMSYSILQRTNVEKLYSVDPYCGSYFADFAAKGILDLYFFHVKARLGQFGERSQMLRMDSLEAGKLFKENELDFVFIDADHSYESVKQDVKLWYTKVRSGGVIAGDDYATRWPGVPQAVDEFFKVLGLTVNQEKDSPRVWWVQKP